MCSQGLGIEKLAFSNMYGTVQILSVDDEEVNQIVLEEILTSTGYQYARWVRFGSAIACGARALAVDLCLRMMVSSPRRSALFACARMCEQNIAIKKCL